MTIEQIKERIEAIKAISGDSESAHLLEDELRRDFIEYVSTLDNRYLAEKAALVLSTKDIPFSRWFS